MIPSPLIQPSGDLSNLMMFELVTPQTTSNPTGYPVIFPFMVLHVNPQSMSISHSKLITRQVTRGGFVSQHWGEELDTISCSASTGAFVSVASGLSVLNRKASIAYQKYIELVSLFQNNGSVYDQRGNIIIHYGVKLHYSSNIYTGYFESLTVEESENPFSFQVNFDFKIENTYRRVGR